MNVQNQNMLWQINEKIQQRIKFEYQTQQQMTSLKYSAQSESNPQNNFSRINDAYFTRELLKRLNKYNDRDEVNLEESIPIFYELNIFQELTSIPDAKKRLTQSSSPNHRLQLEARFIYNLWKVIGEQTIVMGELKEIITLFMTQETSDIAARLEEMFQNQTSAIIQLLAIWQGMVENKSQQSSSFQQSSVLTQQGMNMTSNQRSQQRYSNPSPNNTSQYSNSQPRQKENLTHQRQPTQKPKPTKPFTDRYQSRRQLIEDVRNEIYNSNLYDIPVMTVEKQKEMVNRLYVVNKYDKYQELKKMQDEERLMKEMQECTFRPNIDRRNGKRPQSYRPGSSKKGGKTIPGFEKAIERMKVGQEKAKELKQKLQLRNITVTQTAAKQQPQTKQIVPPKFLSRTNLKPQKKTLFTIQFDIGRNKIVCKIHQNQSPEQLAKNIQSIYSLKQDSFEQIKGIIEQEISRYYEMQRQREQEERNQGEENYDQGENQQHQNQEEHQGQNIYQERKSVESNRNKSHNKFVFC